MSQKETNININADDLDYDDGVIRVRARVRPPSVANFVATGTTPKGS